MEKIYHITSSPNKIKSEGFQPKENIRETPKDDDRIQEVAENLDFNYPIDRTNANFFYPSIQDIPYNYSNNHIVVVNCSQISKKMFMADRDLRDNIVFGDESQEKVLKYLRSIIPLDSANITTMRKSIDGTPEIIVHGQIRPEFIVEVCRGKFPVVSMFCLFDNILYPLLSTQP